MKRNRCEECDAWRHAWKWEQEHRLAAEAELELVREDLRQCRMSMTTKPNSQS